MKDILPYSQTAYLVLKFIFILVCSHYRNRTLSVLHNLRNSLVCTDKKSKLSHGCSNTKSAMALFISFHSFLNNCASHSRYFSDELDAQIFYSKKERMFTFGTICAKI